jgi:periplasmic protein TonB
MFEQHASGKNRKLPRYTAISIAAHAAIIALFLVFASYKGRQVEKKEVEISFIGPGKGKGAPPPPPPPPAGAKHATPQRHKMLAKREIPKVLEQPKAIQAPQPKEEPPPPPPSEEEDDDDSPYDGVVGGVEGGVQGGVVGGVVGGVTGGTGGGGSMQPTAPERPKAKNVPPFVIAKDMLRQSPPRMSEVFKRSHRAQTVNGMYRVCVGTDGAVYEVTPVKAIEGATDEIVEGIKADWLYRPQPVPVCFLYNMVVTVQE